jgi:hypothetical protein
MQFGASENTFPLVPENVYVVRYLGCEARDLNEKRNNGPTANMMAIHKLQAISPPLPPEIKHIEVLSPTTLTPANKFGLMVDKMVPGFVQYTLANQGQQWGSDMFVGCVFKVVISHVNKKNGTGKRADPKAFLWLDEREAQQFGVQHSPVQRQYMQWGGGQSGGGAPQQGQAPQQQPPSQPQQQPGQQPANPWGQQPAAPAQNPAPAAPQQPSQPWAQPQPGQQAPPAQPPQQPQSNPGQWQPPAQPQPGPSGPPPQQGQPWQPPSPAPAPNPSQPFPQPGGAPSGAPPAAPPAGGPQQYPSAEPRMPWPGQG